MGPARLPCFVGLRWPIHLGSGWQMRGLPQAAGEGCEVCPLGCGLAKTGHPSLVPWGLFCSSQALLGRAGSFIGWTISVAVGMATVSNGRAVALGHPRGTLCALMSPWRPTQPKSHHSSHQAALTVPFPALKARWSFREATLQWPKLGGTCGNDDVRLEGSKLRDRHNVPVHPGHRHPGALCIGGVVFWVLGQGDGIWLQ